MHGPSDFAALLSLISALDATTILTDADKASVLAVARDHFLGQAHDPRLVEIAERITVPAPKPVARARRA